MKWINIIKSQEEASAASNLANLQDYLKDAPKYIKTALNEIERYLGEKNV